MHEIRVQMILLIRGRLVCAMDMPHQQWAVRRWTKAAAILELIVNSGTCPKKHLKCANSSLLPDGAALLFRSIWCEDKPSYSGDSANSQRYEDMITKKISCRTSRGMLRTRQSGNGLTHSHLIVMFDIEQLDVIAFDKSRISLTDGVCRTRDMHNIDNMTAEEIGRGPAPAHALGRPGLARL